MQYSIVNYSKKEYISLRLDVEYYHPIFLKTEKQLKRNNWDYLENLSESIKSFGAYSLCNQVEYKENGIPFILRPLRQAHGPAYPEPVEGRSLPPKPFLQELYS